MVLGNIMGEGGAAAATNDALEKTADWGNNWLRRGLEHLSADEVVHINFGKKWARRCLLPIHTSTGRKACAPPSPPRKRCGRHRSVGAHASAPIPGSVSSSGSGASSRPCGMTLYSSLLQKKGSVLSKIAGPLAGEDKVGQGEALVEVAAVGVLQHA